MMEGGAYGASFAGGAFDLQNFVRLPQTILRILSWVSHAEALASNTSQLSHQKRFPGCMRAATDSTKRVSCVVCLALLGCRHFNLSWLPIFIRNNGPLLSYTVNVTSRASFT